MKNDFSTICQVRDTGLEKGWERCKFPCPHRVSYAGDFKRGMCPEKHMKINLKYMKAKEMQIKMI